MQITYKQIPVLLQAHMAIDGSVSSAEGSGEVRIKVAHNLKRLREAHETLMETKKKVFLEITEGRETVQQSDPANAKIAARFNEIDQTPVEIKLWSVPYQKLNPDTISPQVLEAMTGLIKDVPDLGEPDC